MVEEVRAQGEVAGSNPVGRVAAKFTQKMPELAGEGLHRLKKFHFFPYFLGFFSDPTLPSVGHLAKTLPSARQKTLGKDTFTDSFFAEYPLPNVNWALPSAPDTRQSH